MFRRFMPVVFMWMIVTLGLAACNGYDRGIVVILVVDDFGPLDGDVVDELQLSDENCLITPDGLGYYGSTGFVDIPELGPPHGWWVYSQLQESAYSAGFRQVTSTMDQGTGFSKPKDWIPQIDLWRLNDVGDILLVAVDTQGFTTSTITPRIEEALSLFADGAELNGYDVTSTHFVLNMSFGIVPCDPLDGSTVGDYQNLLIGTELDGFYISLERLEIDPNDVQEDTFIELVRVIAVQKGIPEDKALSLLYTTINWPENFYSGDDDPSSVIDALRDDPLLDWLSNYLKVSIDSGEIVAISVAAAGNSGKIGYSFPFAPAIWDSVVSISAEDSPGNWAPYSNPGEIMMNGEFSGSFDMAEISQEQVPTDEDFSVEGTSFAAPRFSVQAAVYLLEGGLYPCINHPNVVPPLGYAGDNGSWENMTLAGAAENYCPTFLIPGP